MDTNVLKKLGFSDKSAKVYLALLSLGPSSVRKLAEHCDLNRGTTYDALKWLQEKGVVNYYRKETKQTFVAEDPARLRDMVATSQAELDRAQSKLDSLVPELQALHHKGGQRPMARYYSAAEIPQILQDVIDTCERSEDRLYRIYSVEGIRKYLYEGFPTFSDVRIGKGIGVQVIAIGEGGELRGLDERKWITANEREGKPTYIIIYPGKTAYISLDAKGDAVGVVIENDGVSTTQTVIFDQLWKQLS